MEGLTLTGFYLDGDIAGVAYCGNNIILPHGAGVLNRGKRLTAF
jgi:hypothetical protein